MNIIHTLKRYPVFGMVSVFILSLCFQAKAQTSNFDYTGNIVTYTVPNGVTKISILAKGAQGGNGGGLGAEIKGDFIVTPGEVFKIIVGEAGYSVTSSSNSGGGGGGGTFVVKQNNNAPLVIAGGGGGQSSTFYTSGTFNPALSGGQIGTSGGSVHNNGGGVNGNGGSSGLTDCCLSGTKGGSGGGGLLTNGANGASGTGGMAFVNGGAGGAGTTAANGKGGFGGGGGAAYDNAVRSGGGGGYSGGQGGSFVGSGLNYAHGAGGGSFNGGTNQTNQPGANAGNGKVIITVLNETFYKDEDADGYGNANISLVAVSQPEGYVNRAGDCNDNDATIHPGAVDLCDGIDRNCDGVVLAQPTANLSGSQTICAGESTNLTFNLTGVAPWTLTYTDGTTPVTVNNIQASPYMVTVNPSETKTYGLTAVADAHCAATTLTGNAVITVNTKPVVAPIANINALTDAGVAGASINLAATATGLPAPTLTYKINQKAVTSPYLFPIGTTVVTAKAVNSCGSDSTTFSVTVADQEPPVALAKNITVQLNSEGTASVTAAEIDNGSSDAAGLTSVVLSQTDFDCSHVGENQVTLTVTDNHGNVSTATATITVEDKVAPVAIAKNLTVQLDAAGQVGISATDVNNGSSDACGIASVELSKTSFDCSNVGENTVTLTVTDKNGNISTTTATITVEDKEAPIALAKNIKVQLDATGQVSIAAADVNNGSSDACGLAMVVLSKTTFDCSNTGENTVTLTVTDNHNNVATTTAIVTVEDNIAPTIVAPAAVTVNVDADKNTASNVALSTPVTADNCTVAQVTNNAPAEFPTGTTTVTWTVTDAAGNKTTATQTVTVRPNIIAVANLNNATVPIRTNFNQLNSKLPTTAEVTYSDNTKQNLSVTWVAGSYNGLVAGNYELIGTLTIPSETTNLNNLEAKVSVTVEPNKVPTALAFSTNTFKPNVIPDEAIGNFSTTDPDDTEFTYTLVTGTGDANNSLFEIKGDKLYLKSNKGLSGTTQFTIRVKTTDPYLNTLEKEFKLTKGSYAKAPEQLKIVNTFTPNGDGYNDEWTVPELKFYNKISVEVFDRAGVRLFHTTNPEKGWNGKNQNGESLKGAFFYVIQIEDIKLTQKGVLTVLKK